jgi:carboxyl-terminal processing protease
VQSVYTPNGGYNLKLTTGKWFTPSGRSIHRERKLLDNGDFVEVHPDSLKAADMARPMFKSDAGRVVYGGGGIRPDVIVSGDTLTKAERDFLRAAAPLGPKINKVMQDYALELKGTVPRDFTVPAAWSSELVRRLAADSVKFDAKLEPAGVIFLTHDLATRVTRMSYGDAAAKVRNIAEDKPLSKAIELLQKSATQAQLLALGAQQPAPTRK